MKRHLLWLIGAATILGTTVTACEDVEPGDYVVYRVAATQASLSDGCYWSYQGADQNVRHDKNTMRSGATFILYAGANEEFHLDTGAVTLDGKQEGESSDGDVYDFDGRVVDVQWDNADGTGDMRTTTVDTKVEMTVDGALVFGELKIKTSFSCQGQNCGEIAPSCTETIDFVGTEVEDVDLEHLVANGDSAGSGMNPPDDDDGSSGTTGSGGSTSSSGSGGSGGGASCSSCSDFAQDMALYADLCAASAPLADDLATCACAADCYTDCADNLCGLASPSAACNSCIVSFCSPETTACYNDGPAG